MKILSLFLMIFFFIAFRAEADFYSTSWPKVKERMEQLSPLEHTQSLLTMDCVPSQQAEIPSIKLGTSWSLVLSSPRDEFMRSCYPVDHPLYTIYHRDGEMIVYYWIEEKMKDGMGKKENGKQKTDNRLKTKNHGSARTVGFDETSIKLKEWIYTEAPNDPQGSRYIWELVEGKQKLEERGQKVDAGEYAAEHETQDTSQRTQVTGHWLPVSGDGSQVSDHINIFSTPDGGAVIALDDQHYVIEPITYWTKDEVEGRVAIEVGGQKGEDGRFTNDISRSTNREDLLVLNLTPPTANHQLMSYQKSQSHHAPRTTQDYESETSNVKCEMFDPNPSPHSPIQSIQFHIQAPKHDYPLLIDPTISYGRAIGSWESTQTSAYSIAIETTNDEIYVGGTTVGLLSAPVMLGTMTFAGEGFVMEISDAATPVINWVHLFGGFSASNNIYSVAVNGDEVYAAGSTDNSQSFETIGTVVGTFASGGNYENFVVEIADAATPSVNWLQWFGDPNESSQWNSYVAVNGDEIYAGGTMLEGVAAFETVATVAGTTDPAGVYDGWVIEIQDGVTPSINWLYWLGGKGYDIIYGIAVNGDEVYATGTTVSSTDSWDTAGTEVGTYNGVQEIFLVEIADGATPVLNWRYWIGANSIEYPANVAVNNDEIYVLGYTATSTVSWDTFATVVGTFTAGTEVFVVEIADAATPSGNWMVWLGGAGSDRTNGGLVINGDEIYASGMTGTSTDSWETVGTVVGTFTPGSEMFVVEIADAATPVINWLQWMGGTGTDESVSMAVNADEIYALGRSVSSPDNFDTVGTIVATAQGASTAGFIIEIADNTTPTVNWLTWVTGTGGATNMNAIAVTGDEIYVGGATQAFTWTNGTFPKSGDLVGYVSEGFVIEIADAVSPTITWVQWVGGVALDSVEALALNGDEIYAGGRSGSTSSWETVGAVGGTFNTGNTEGFVVEIADGTTPSINWLQWLGGGAADSVNDIAINGDEIYAGGASNSSTASWDTYATQAGTYTGGSEGWVVEIADGTTPSINWIQWLGAGGTEFITSVAVVADEVYAGGHSVSSTASWDTAATEAGTYNGVQEGWVVEIADSSSPTINWRYWLGGSGTDLVNDIAVNGDEIYAGGYSISSTSWQTVAAQDGTFTGSNESFVVEIADAATPSINWLQWLGGTSGDLLFSLGVNGEEIYAGGYTGTATTSWDTVGVISGTYTGAASEAFLVEIADATTPSVNWLYWLGGDSGERLNNIFVSSNEVYVTGIISGSSTGWEVAMPDMQTKQYGFYVEIFDDVTASGANAIFFGMPF